MYFERFSVPRSCAPRFLVVSSNAPNDQNIAVWPSEVDMMGWTSRPEVVAGVSVEGGYGATVEETGLEEPDALIVPGARIYDLVPVRELPYGPAAPLMHQRPGQMAASDYVPIFFKKRLHLAGVHR
jgi:hypothetical protein